MLPQATEHVANSSGHYGGILFSPQREPSMEIFRKLIVVTLMQIINEVIHAEHSHDVILVHD